MSIKIDIENKCASRAREGYYNLSMSINNERISEDELNLWLKNQGFKFKSSRNGISLDYHISW
jgi:hypothetical protein